LEDPLKQYTLRSTVEVAHLARLYAEFAQAYASGTVPESIARDAPGALAQVEAERLHWAEQVPNLQEQARAALVEACQALASLIASKPGNPEAPAAINRVRVAAAVIEDLIQSKRVLALP
jgi:hypothetical protein